MVADLICLGGYSSSHSVADCCVRLSVHIAQSVDVMVCLGCAEDLATACAVTFFIHD